MSAGKETVNMPSPEPSMPQRLTRRGRIALAFLVAMAMMGAFVLGNQRGERRARISTTAMLDALHARMETREKRTERLIAELRTDLGIEIEGLKTDVASVEAKVNGVDAVTATIAERTEEMYATAVETKAAMESIEASVEAANEQQMVELKSRIATLLTSSNELKRAAASLIKESGADSLMAKFERWVGQRTISTFEDTVRDYRTALVTRVFGSSGHSSRPTVKPQVEKVYKPLGGATALGQISSE